jgi:hypothetical protein
MTRVGRFISTILVLGTTVLMQAVGRPHLDLCSLADSASVIVIADVSDSSSTSTSASIGLGGRTLAAREYSTRLHVRTFVKGSGPSEMTVRYVLPVEFVGYVRIQTGLRLVFLKSDRDGFTVANPYYPDLPAVNVTVIGTAMDNEEQVCQAVFHELADVLGSVEASITDKFQVLQISFAIPANAYFISSLKQGVNVATTQQLRLALQAQLLISGDVSEFAEIARELRDNAMPPQSRAGLLYAIGNWVKNPSVVPELTSLAGNHDAALRTAAAEALWHIADPTSKGTLATLLDDSDRNVRYYAVRGLADITGQNLWGPSVPEFQEHEAYYLVHWRQWASSAGYLPRQVM